MSELREYISILLEQDDASVKDVIKKIQPNLKRMTKAELELLKLQVQKMIEELG